MSRIELKFDELREKGKKALITFVTAGDPTLEATKNIVRELERSGSDIIEIGIPYSDPVAEGPVIQAANSRALKNGIKISDIFGMVSDVRKTTEVPLVFMLYYNCILQYGCKRFLADCAQTGIDGLIIVDLPFEERDEIDETACEYGVDIISMVSPTSKDRIQKISRGAKGFLYCVTSLGVTGMRSGFSTDFNEFFSYINKFSSVPKALGFGISTPEHIKALKRYCDGLIVGSAVVKQIERSATPEEAVTNVGEFVKTLREALDN